MEVMVMFRPIALAVVLICSIAALMTGCRGVDSNNGGGSNGEINLGITDGPLDGVDQVRLALAGVEITPTGGSPILIEDLDEDLIDLLDLQGNNRELLLDEYDLADGSYESVRLIINETDSFVEDGNAMFPLTVPVSEEANLTIAVDVFLDDDNDLEDFTIDIDLRKSLRVDTTQSPRVYELHPRIRVIDTTRSETLRGTVDESLITDSRCSNNNDDGNAVYLFEGSSSDFQDIQDNTNDPFATTTVNFNTDNGLWEFEFGFLPRQSYRAFFTCDAILDDPEQDDAAMINIEGPVSIDVQQNNSETISFVP